MSLRDAIRKATAGVVPQIIGPAGFAGSTVTTTRYVKVRDAAARSSNTPTHPIVGGQWYIREIADAHAQRVWGLTSSASAEAQLPLGTDVLENDVVHVDAGDFAGHTYEVQQTRTDLNGSRILVALGPTGQVAAP